jgi:hypothetical protein
MTCAGTIRSSGVAGTDRASSRGTAVAKVHPRLFGISRTAGSRTPGSADCGRRIRLLRCLLRPAKAWATNARQRLAVQLFDPQLGQHELACAINFTVDLDRCRQLRALTRIASGLRTRASSRSSLPGSPKKWGGLAHLNPHSACRAQVIGVPLGRASSLTLERPSRQVFDRSTAGQFRSIAQRAFG